MNIEVLHKFITEFLNGEFSETSKALIKATADAATASANCNWFMIQVLPIAFIIGLTIFGSLAYVGKRTCCDELMGVSLVMIVLGVVVFIPAMIINCSQYMDNIAISNNPIGYILRVK